MRFPVLTALCFRFLQAELEYRGGRLRNISKVQIGANVNLWSDNSVKVKVNYIYECSDVYLIVMHYEETGNYLGYDRYYIGRQGNCGSLGGVEVPQPDENGGGNNPPEEDVYATSRDKLWIVAYVTETFAIWCQNTFTTRDGIITAIGFKGIGRDHIPPNTTFTETNRGGTIFLPDYLTAETHATANVFYVFEPNPAPFPGSKN